MDEKVRRIWPEWEIDALAPDHGILGSGSFGDVYRIRRSTHGIMEYAALKIITIPRDNRELNQLRQEYESEEHLSSFYNEVKQSFEKEYATMAMLRGHANIVYCDDIRFDPHTDNQGWDIHIKMELLIPMMKHKSSITPEDIARKVGIDICKALVLCHKHGIIHRDIKPANIFVSRDGNYKLGDFGIAKQMEGTQFGTMAGTEDYMSPEVNFFQPYSGQADIYSLGLVLYWILNGHVGPFLSSEDLKTNIGIKKKAARIRRLSGEPLPKPVYGSIALNKIVLKACSFDQKNRYGSAQEMLQALLALDTASVTTPASTEEENTIREPRTSADKRTLQAENTATVYSATPVSSDPMQKSSSSVSGNSDFKSEPYAQRPSRKNAVTEVPPKPVTSAQYSYVPPKKDAVTATPPKKVQSEPYSYVPPKQTTSSVMITKVVLPKSPVDKSGHSAVTAEKFQEGPHKTATQQNKTAADTAQKSAKHQQNKPFKKASLRWAWFILIFGVVGLVCCIAFSSFDQGKGLTAETVTNTVGNDSISLLEIGYIDDPDRDLWMLPGYVTEISTNSEYDPWYTCRGEKIEELQFTKIRYRGNGFFEGYRDVEGINDLSLFTEYGEVIVSQDACLIDWPWVQEEKNARYLMIYKADKESFDEENYLVSDEGSFITPYYTSGIMYSGTVQIYDTQMMRFVPNLPTITRGDNVAICGENIFVLTDDGRYQLYDPEGQLLLETTNLTTIGDGYLLSHNQGTYYIYDEFGNCTYTSNIYLRPLNNEDPYIIMEQGGTDTYKIIDNDGNVVLDGHKATGYCGGLFQTYNDDHEYGLMSVEGQEILSCKYSYVNELYEGYFIAEYNDRYTLANRDGILVTDLTDRPNNMMIEKDGSLFVYNTRSYSLPTNNGRATSLTDGLVKIRSEDNGLWTVYDLFTGEALLPYEYEEVDYAADHLYVYRDGGWGVFEVYFLRDGKAY